MELNFSGISVTAISRTLQKIAEAEAIPLSPDQAKHIAHSVNGDLQNAIKTLQLYGCGKVDLALLRAKKGKKVNCSFQICCCEACSAYASNLQAMHLHRQVWIANQLSSAKGGDQALPPIRFKDTSTLTAITCSKGLTKGVSSFQPEDKRGIWVVFYRFTALSRQGTCSGLITPTSSSCMPLPEGISSSKSRSAASSSFGV